MKNFTNYLGKKLCLNIPLYYILNFTWGLFTTLLGFLVLLILWPFGTIKRHNYVLYLELRKPTKNGWGFSIGTIFICTPRPSDATKYPWPDHLLDHEYGHTVQNAIFGPFTLFLVSFPSLIRFWYRRLYYKIKLRNPKTSYYDIWFEGSASDIGTHYSEQTRIKKLIKKTKENNSGINY